MRILTRYIVRQIWAPALLAAVVIAFLVIAGAIQEQLKVLLEDLPMAQIGVMDIARISVFVLPAMIGYILPIPFLLGIMYSFGRMAAANEILAMKAAGVSLKRLTLPVLAMGAVLSAVCLVALDYGQPWAHKRLTQFMASDLPLRMTLDLLPRGVMHEYGEWGVYIGRKDEQGLLHDIMILQHDDDGVTTLYAETAQVIASERGRRLIELRNGHFIPPNPERRGVFSRATQPIPSLVGEPEEPGRQSRRLPALLAHEARLQKEYEATQALPVAGDLRKERMEIAERLSFPLMCLAMAFVAAPIGARARSAGRSYTFAAGVLIVAAYFVLRKVVELQMLPSLPQAILIAQLPNIVLMLVGAALIWRVDRV